MHIRNSVKAILIEGDSILLTKNRDENGYFFLYPGGGQDHGETFHDTLLRECMEEIGRHVEIKELLYIREYIGKNHEHSSFDFDVHQIEYYFACLLSTENFIKPSNPDNHQVGIEWIPIKKVINIPNLSKRINQTYKSTFRWWKMPNLFRGYKLINISCSEIFL